MLISDDDEEAHAVVDNRSVNACSRGLKSLRSIANLSKMVNLRVLNAHMNSISRIENLGTLVNLTELNLSANEIHKIEGLEGLVSLRDLNLSSNRIERVEGLSSLHGSAEPAGEDEQSLATPAV